jgi:flagellar hook-associated protein 3 FlgL
MRISTSAIYDANVSMLNQQQARLLHTQQQLATGRRMLTPADDPVASARALEVAQSDATNTQYATNRDAAKHSTSMAESVLQSVTSLLQDARTTAIQAGAGTLSSSDKQSLATDLSSRLDELISLANSTDGAGNYLFSGFQGRTQPFAKSAAGVQYTADDGQRMLQVSGSRQMAASDSGADIFMRIKNGSSTPVAIPVTAPLPLNTGAAIAVGDTSITLASPANTSTFVVGAPISGPGFPAGTTVQSITNATTFVTSAAATAASPAGTALNVGAGNTGSGIVSQAVVTNPAAFPGHNYQLTFSVAAGVTTYSVNDTILGTTLSSGNPYSSGQNISFGGLSFTITGAPANGDAFTVGPPQNESMFKTISDLIGAMGTSSAQLTDGLDRAISMLDRHLDNVSAVRSSLGSRLREIDSLQSTGDDLGLNFKATLSQLQDVDYNKGISDLNQQQLGLQAAQKSFKQVSDLSLFNYL